jgi:hypothetical protein
MKVSQETNIPLEPAAVALMASIVAKSLTQYLTKNPEADLTSGDAVRKISEAVAIDMITAVSHLASKIPSASAVPSRPESAYQRAAHEYQKAQSGYTKSTGGAKAVDPFTGPGTTCEDTD